MPETVIICNEPGDEVLYCGGLLAKYAEAVYLKKEERPFVIYNVIADYEKNNKFISKSQQTDEIKEVAKLLKFNYEILFEGRKYKKNFPSKKEYISKLKPSLEFLEPKSVIFPLSAVIMLFQASTVISSIKEIKDDLPFNMMSYIEEGHKVSTPNQFLELTPKQVDTKKKAFNLYKHRLEFNIGLMDKLVKEGQQFGKAWKVDYVESFCFHSGIIY